VGGQFGGVQRGVLVGVGVPHGQTSGVAVGVGCHAGVAVGCGGHHEGAGSGVVVGAWVGVGQTQKGTPIPRYAAVSPAIVPTDAHARVKRAKAAMIAESQTLLSFVAPGSIRLRRRPADGGRVSICAVIAI
jgi:hypothetical protein